MTEIGEISEDEHEELEELTEKDPDELSDGEITSRTKLSIKRRFDFPTWVLVFEFQNRHGKRADCLALNTRASRNFKLVGFEFKSSRNDWLSEKRNHEKADYFVQLCDEWYVVAGRTGIVKEEELPDGWGLLEVKPSGQIWKLQESDLSDIQDTELDRQFFAKFIKRVVGEESNFTYSDIQEARRRGYQKAKERAKEDILDVDEQRLKEKAKSFEKIQDSALSIHPPVDDDRIERLEKAEVIVQSIKGDGFTTLRREVERFKDRVNRTHEDIVEEVERLQRNFEEIEESLNNTGGSDDETV